MIDAQESRSGTLRLILAEVLLLVLTIVLGATLVVMVVFLPRFFSGTDAFTWAGVQAYGAAVRDYLFGLLRGNLGHDSRGRPIGVELFVAVRHSLELVGISILVALPLGLLWGGLLATFRRGMVAALLFGLSTLVISLPSFAVILLTIEAIATLTLRTGVRLTYVQGYGLDRHLIIPVGVLALRGAAYLARAVQVAQEEIMRQDWVQVARAKGLGGWSLWRRHVLPALRLPLLGSTLGMLRVVVTNMVIVDYLYNWGGLGHKMLQVTNGTVSINDGGIAAGAAISFVICFVLADTLGRLVMSRADPRLRETTHR